jgi:hypothetical protein
MGFGEKARTSLDQTLQPGWHVEDLGESCSDSDAAFSLLNRNVVSMPSQSLSSVQDSVLLGYEGRFETLLQETSADLEELVICQVKRRAGLMSKILSAIIGAQKRVCLASKILSAMIECEPQARSRLALSVWLTPLSTELELLLCYGNEALTTMSKLQARQVLFSRSSSAQIVSRSASELDTIQFFTEAMSECDGKVASLSAQLHRLLQVMSQKEQPIVGPELLQRLDCLS